MLDVRNMMVQRRELQCGMRFCLITYPCQVWVHRGFTPCIVSVFPLSRVLARGTFHSTGVSRFIARPGPVPLQRLHLHRFCYVAGAYSGTACPRESLYARVAPLPLFGSMLSETPGARQPLSLACTDAWLARRSIRSAGFDHGAGHPLLLLYDAKAPIGKNSNYFNDLWHYPFNYSIGLF